MTEIFVTVGTQLPFDRLVKAVEAWVGNHDVTATSFAQIGATTFNPPIWNG